MVNGEKYALHHSFYYPLSTIHYFHPIDRRKKQAYSGNVKFKEKRQIQLMLELKNVYFTVQESEENSGGLRNIIDGINFTFEDGKFYAITGPNGSGKTTLAKLIMGVNPVSQGAIISRDRIFPPGRSLSGQKPVSPTAFNNRRASRVHLSRSADRCHRY